MNPQDSLTELAARVGQIRPQLDAKLISKTLTKLQKICSTLNKRERSEYFDEKFDSNTQQFCRKGEELAQELGGLLIYEEKDRSYVLHIDKHIERII